MPAVTVENPLALPRITRPDATTTRARPVSRVVAAQHTVEGAGFEVWRPFPGGLSLQEPDPFLLLDQLGPVVYEPREAKGAPWHPHRGFETVTYVLDGEIAHHDSNGGGGVIGEGDTQWMTAGAGILHDEVPTERVLARGRPRARRAALGEPAGTAEVHTAALPGDHGRPPHAAVVTRRWRTGAPDRGRARRPPRAGRHAHTDRVRARDRRARRGARRAVEPRVQLDGIRARRSGLRGHGGASRRRP